MGNNVFAFGFDNGGFPVPNVQVAPNAPHFGGFSWATSGDGFGSMELVKLTERLGSYFGTDQGLLVVRAPDDEDLQLEDGDVILSIDGRTPTSVRHAMRILGSYESGEELNIEIMRDKRKRSITLEIPEQTKLKSACKATSRADSASRQGRRGRAGEDLTPDFGSNIWPSPPGLLSNSGRVSFIV